MTYLLITALIAIGSSLTAACIFAIGFWYRGRVIREYIRLATALSKQVNEAIEQAKRSEHMRKLADGCAAHYAKKAGAIGEDEWPN